MNIPESQINPTKLLQVGLKDQIVISVRVRPLSNNELNISDYETIKIINDSTLILTNQQKSIESQFEFNRVFDSKSQQKDIFSNFIAENLTQTFMGFNSSYLTYGAVKSGKTYSFFNDQDNPGIITRALNFIFLQIDTKYKDIIVHATLVELYNENLKDLLTQQLFDLDIREDPVKGVVIAGTTDKIVKSTVDVMNLLKVQQLKIKVFMQQFGKKYSTLDSKAHQILTLSFENSTEITKIQVFDLGTSERGGKGNKVNTSIAALGNCIQSLYESQEKGLLYIPYRNSKLTRLMKECLGGNTRAYFLACVSPAVTAYEETLNTLNQMSQATNLKKSNKLQDNQLQKQKSIELVMEQLKKENEELKQSVINYQQIALQQIKPVVEQVVEKKQEIKIIKEKTKLSSIEQKLQEHQSKINLHFEEEKQLKESLFQCHTDFNQLQINMNFNEDNIQQKRNNIKNQEEVIFLQKQIDQYQEELLNLSGKIQEIKQNYSKLLANRKLIQQVYNNIIQNQKDIDKSAFEETSKKYLLSLYNQGVLNIENMDVKQNEKNFNIMKEEQERQILFLKEQLKQKDEIIIQQTNTKQFIKPNIKLPRIQSLSNILNVPSDFSHDNKNTNSPQNKTKINEKIKYNSIGNRHDLPMRPIVSDYNISQQYQLQKALKQKLSLNLNHNQSQQLINNVSLPTLQTKKQLISTLRKENNSQSSGQAFQYDSKTGGYRVKETKNQDHNVSRQFLVRKRYGNESSISEYDDYVSRQSPQRTPQQSPSKSKHQQRINLDIEYASTKALLNNNHIVLPSKLENSVYVQSFMAKQKQSGQTRVNSDDSKVIETLKKSKLQKLNQNLSSLKQQEQELTMPMLNLSEPKQLVKVEAEEKQKVKTSFFGIFD